MKKHIPNAITSCNLLCGCIAIVFALNGDAYTAAYFIFAAAIFDFFDGFAARLLKAYSPVGRELDSLADVVSFGVAPSAIMYGVFTQSGIALPSWVFFGPFLFAVFSAVRLAKFNVDERQTDSFLGLPTPAAAMLVIGLPFFNWTNQLPYIYMALIPIVSYLLICELPMFSLKIKKQANSAAFVKKYRLQLVFILSSLFFIIFLRFAGLSAAIGLYILLSVVVALTSKKQSKSL